MPPVLELCSPAQGFLRPLEQVPDPVFSEHMLGNGFAIEPAEGILYAPFAGTVSNINKNAHALVLTQNGFEILLHIGLETVALKGQGFEVLVQEGQSVSCGQALIRFDLAALKNAVPCYWIMCTVTAPEAAPVALSAPRAVKPGEKVAVAGAQEFPAAATSAPENAPAFDSAPITITNPNGLHARPAGVLARLAAQYDFPILIVYNQTETNAKSTVSIMALALEKGSVIRLRARTADEQAAQSALTALTQALTDGLGETPCKCAPKPALDFSRTLTLKALSCGGGFAHGPACVYTAGEIPFEENAQNPAAEQTRLNEILAQQEETLQEEISHASSAAAQDILQAHLGLLKDPFLLSHAQKIMEQGKTAAFAFNEAIRASVELLKKTKNRFLMERIADLKDLRKRVLLALNGQSAALPAFPAGCVIFAEDLLPSDLAFLEGRVSGVVLAAGSPTAHVCIMLRNMGLPALACAGEEVLQIPAGSDTFIDAAQGTLYINPSAPDRARLLTEMDAARLQLEQDIQAGQAPALTLDGVRITVGGNICNEKEALQAYQNGADSLGLVRTELLFLQNQTHAPSEDEQLRQYQGIVNAMHGRPVTLRTLDIGGDKPAPYLNLPPEENPVLGIRGVRAYGTNKEVFLSQLRAMLRVQPAGQVRIMIPMVGFVSEAQACRRLIEQEKQALGIQAKVETGIMVEVPSAALLAEQFAQTADFFSLGTNDLTQYTLAIDRGHPLIAARADHLHPAVLHLIARTGQAAQAAHIPAAVCGAMAGDTDAVPLLVGLGITELAVSAGAIGKIKALVRRLNAADCRALAQQALILPDAQAVRELVRRHFSK